MVDTAAAGTTRQPHNHDRRHTHAQHDTHCNSMFDHAHDHREYDTTTTARAVANSLAASRSQQCLAHLIQHTPATLFCKFSGPHFDSSTA